MIKLVIVLRKSFHFSLCNSGHHISPFFAEDGVVIHPLCTTESILHVGQVKWSLILEMLKKNFSQAARTIDNVT